MKEDQQEQPSRVEAPQHDPLVKVVADLVLRIEAIEAQLANTTQQQAMKEARVPEATTELSEKAEEIRRMYEGASIRKRENVLDRFNCDEALRGLLALAAADAKFEERLYRSVTEEVAEAVAAEREPRSAHHQPPDWALNRSPVPADARQEYIAVEATETFDRFLVCIDCGAVVHELSTQVHRQFHAKLEGRKP